MDEDGTAYIVQDSLSSGSPGRATAALLVQQRAQYVTAHYGRDIDEGVSTGETSDKHATASGRSKGTDSRDHTTSSSEMNRKSWCELAQKMPEGTQKMPEGTQKMPVGTFSKSGTGSSTSISAPRWADLDCEGAMSKAEVLRLLAVLGLPHLCDMEGREQSIFKAFPEFKETQDLLIDHGLSIGRKRAGRHGLPSRLGPHTADPIRGGALSSEVHAASTARRSRIL